MRISDWSSDVCSSDLANRARALVATEHRDLFRRPLVPAELNRFGAIILDPPRAGAEEQVKQLAASTAPVIAYVSCNPASFARDAKILVEGGSSLDWVQPVGQFRWSTPEIGRASWRARVCQYV